jgi:hypothetical protein
MTVHWHNRAINIGVACCICIWGCMCEWCCIWCVWDGHDPSESLPHQHLVVLHLFLHSRHLECHRISRSWNMVPSWPRLPSAPSRACLSSSSRAVASSETSEAELLDWELPRRRSKGEVRSWMLDEDYGEWRRVLRIRI